MTIGKHKQARVDKKFAEAPPNFVCGLNVKSLGDWSEPVNHRFADTGPCFACDTLGRHGFAEYWFIAEHIPTNTSLVVRKFTSFNGLGACGRTRTGLKLGDMFCFLIKRD